jgi:hypothetical protein
MKDDAVSSIIGALMALIIFTTFIALLQTTAVPVWNSDAEAAHVSVMEDDFFNMKSKIEDASSTPFTKTAKVTMGPVYPKLILLYNPVSKSSGSLYISSGKKVVLGCFASTSQSVSVTNRSFTQSNFSFSENNMSQITSFSVNLTNLQMSAAGSKRKIVITTSGAYASTVDFWRPDNFGTGNDSNLEITSTSSGTTLILGYFNAPTPINILSLEPGLGAFSGLVGITFSLLNSPNPASGTYTLAGTRSMPPQRLTPINDSTSTIRHDPHNKYSTETSYIYENGAIIKLQGNSSMTVSSSGILSVSQNNTSNITYVRVGAILLNSSNYSAGMSDTASIQFSPPATGLSAISVDASNMSLSVDTDYPNLWETYFRNKMNESGVSSSEWSVVKSTSNVTLSINRGATPRINLTAVKSVLTVGIA